MDRRPGFTQSNVSSNHDGIEELVQKRVGVVVAPAVGDEPDAHAKPPQLPYERDHLLVDLPYSEQSAKMPRSNGATIDSRWFCGKSALEVLRCQLAVFE